MRKKKLKILTVFVCIFSFIIGILAGAVTVVYKTLPDTEQLVVGEEVFYSYNSNSGVTKSKITGADDEASIHFLELGNKYTGDCTYIKYGSVDILIDCGSKTNSIATVSSYLNQEGYVTDNKLEYVIVTHAHQDHYAGFATSEKVNGIFDLYEIENIIDFGKATNQSEDKTTYKNYLKKREKAINKGYTLNGGKKETNYFDASSLTKGSKKEFVVDEYFKFELLYNFYQEEHLKYPRLSENNFSVCTLFSHGEKNFLFTGDLEEEGEIELVKNNNLPQVELYKAGHHGSKTSSSETLLEQIKPKTICVCCCAGSSEYTTDLVNQFPTQKFIMTATKYTQNIYVTTLCIDYKANKFESMNGNIVVISVFGQNGIGLDCSNNSLKLCETDWFNSRYNSDFTLKNAS